MFKQDFQKIYTMTNSNKRLDIIQKINKKELISECITGKKQEWWLKKHNPNNEIPKNIYMIGRGTIKEIYDKYITKYGIINFSEYLNYTRELIKQHIMC